MHESRETFHSFHALSHRVLHRFAMEREPELRAVYCLVADIEDGAELPSDASLALNLITGDVTIR